MAARTFLSRCVWLALGCCALLSMLAARPARVDTVFTVNTTRDDVDANPGDGVCRTIKGDCTLRAAIQEANALPGTDTILLPAGTFTLTRAGAGENAAATGDLD